jgi:hypothetical protein
VNPQIKKAWLNALRSGQYKQGQMYLRRRAHGAKDRYCCLGVLCDLVEPDKWDARGGTIVNHGIHGGYPGSTVLRTSGLSADDALHLGSLNDTGKRFDEIASYIEANL